MRLPLDTSRSARLDLRDEVAERLLVEPDPESLECAAAGVRDLAIRFGVSRRVHVSLAIRTAASRAQVRTSESASCAVATEILKCAASV